MGGQTISPTTKSTMNTTEINGNIKYTLAEGEGGKITLTPIITQPEQRKPEAGDVWEHSGTAWLVTDEGHWVTVGAHMPKNLGKNTGEFSPEGESDFRNLGKFPEVYVKISDVRYALSFKDDDGDSVIYSTHDSRIYVEEEAARKIREALAKLGIK